jgi:hypothetical protein
VPAELVDQSIELPSGELHLLQPRESAELPDDGAVEWAPMAPYWSVLWRSGVALARELEGMELRELRVVEPGCGLAVPSIVAARAGATVLATDACSDTLALLVRNVRANHAPSRRRGSTGPSPRRSSGVGRSTWCSPPTSSTSVAASPRSSRSCRSSHRSFGSPIQTGRPPPRSSSRPAPDGRSRPASAASCGSTGCCLVAAPPPRRRYFFDVRGEPE